MSNLYKSDRTVDPEAKGRIGPALTSAAYGLRGSQTAYERLVAQPVTRGEIITLVAEFLAAAKVSPARLPTLQAWLTELDWTGLASARAGYSTLVEILGDDASVADHGFGNGKDTLAVAQIGELVADAEAAHAPLKALRGRAAA